MRKRIQVVLVGLGSLVGVSVNAATPADIARCHDYAERSVKQFELASTHSKCRIAGDPQWHAVMANHFSACLFLPAATANAGLAWRDSVLASCGAATTPADTQPDPVAARKAALAGPHGENGKIVAANGAHYISYSYVASPGAAPQPIVLPVFRPVAHPSPNLPTPRLTNDDTGSWMFLGEGAQANYSALIDLDAQGIATWSFLPPDVVALYKVSATSAPASAPPLGTPGSASQPQVVAQSDLPATGNENKPLHFPKSPPVLSWNPRPPDAEPSTKSSTGQATNHSSAYSVSYKGAQTTTTPQLAELVGEWRQDYRPPPNGDYRTVTLIFVAIGNRFAAVNIEPHAVVPPETPYIDGTYAAGNVFPARLHGADANGVMQWFEVRFNLDDEGHFRLTAPALKADPTEYAFTRVARGAPADARCATNPRSKVTGVEAFARGWLLADTDETSALCWFRVGAELGDTESQAMYAAYVLPSSKPAAERRQAFQFLQSSAMQGSFAGAANLVAAFNNGEFVPRSKQRADYWAGRAYLINPDVIHTKKFLAIPQWASDTAGPCDATNPMHANSETAFRSGRVAFQASGFERAACWFSISHAQGNVRAAVYLGLLNVYGWGVPKNPKQGFQLLDQAGDANDAFALLYLANFYRYGIGTQPDQDRAYRYFVRSLRAPHGFDTYTKVQGTDPDDQEYAAMSRQAESQADEANRACEQARAEGTLRADNATGRVPSCNASGSDFMYDKLIARPAQHTVEHVNEIFPEDLGFDVPLNISMERARLGLK